MIPRTEEIQLEITCSDNDVEGDRTTKKCGETAKQQKCD
jgi:hypothetical protein